MWSSNQNRILTIPIEQQLLFFLYSLCGSVFLQPLSVDVHYYYILELSFYLSLLFSQFTDFKRKVGDQPVQMLNQVIADIVPIYFVKLLQKAIRIHLNNNH